MDNHFLFLIIQKYNKNNKNKLNNLPLCGKGKRSGIKYTNTSFIYHLLLISNNTRFSQINSLAIPLLRKKEQNYIGYFNYPAQQKPARFRSHNPSKKIHLFIEPRFLTQIPFSIEIYVIHKSNKINLRFRSAKARAIQI